MDLLDDDFEDDSGKDQGGNAPEFSVSEISGALKRTIEGEFGHVRVRGELGRVSVVRSGHVYLDLKDDRSVLSGVIWKGVAARLATRPEEGMEVIATGKLTTFGGQSKYQMVIEDIAPAGVGALMAMLEKRKAALQAEGLFSPQRKQALPYLPEVIGVVTSPTGAVIRDILHRLRDRFPRKVLIWPVTVQGPRCAADVAAAIKGFNEMTPGGALPRPDLLIVARGGGSIEDLWGFNEEIVARAVAASAIPLISAVGHETDTTLIDFVSDKRAPTPTAAAELAVPVRLDLLAWVDGQGARLSRASVNAVVLRRQRLRDLVRALPRPETLVAQSAQRLDLWGERLPRALQTGVQTRKLRLSGPASALRPALLHAVVRGAREGVSGTARRLDPAMARQISDRLRQLDATASRLRIGLVQQEAARKRTDLTRLTKRFSEAAQTGQRQRRDHLSALERLRRTLGYAATLERGYAVVRTKKGVVTTHKAASAAVTLEIEFADGRLNVAPCEVAPCEVAPCEVAPCEGGSGPAPVTTPAKPRKAPAKRPKPEQGSLF
jgi:exodeoxyribonuclease VII large subunit